MKARSLRIKIAYIVGLVVAIAATFYLFYLDVSLKSEVKWCLACLLGLVEGGLLMVGAYLLGDADSKAWFPIDLCNCGFAAGFVVTMLNLTKDTALIKAAKKVPSFGFIKYVLLVVAIIGAIDVLFNLVLDLVLYFKLDRARIKEINK